ncbi:MAG: hypothetical protein Q4D57_04725 [Clostridia bacterium]|nr:hypothetical protein [Clostridia bacterium]
MAMVTIGGFFGEVQKDVDLIPIFRENELSKNPDSFLKTAKLIIKKIAISAPSGSKFKINDAEFSMPGTTFELAYGVVDIQKLSFSQNTEVTIAYAY